MLNNGSSSLPSLGHYDARSATKGSRKRAKQQSFKERCFPFHRLPCEIIAEIFVLCLPDIKDVFNSKNAAPMLLCNVSSSWRSLAFSIPRLWNELSILISDPEVEVYLAMAESWIARSGKLPLNLRLHARANLRNTYGPDMVQAHLNTFFRHASRWETVYINLMGTFSIYDCYGISFPEFGPTPLLRKFSYSTVWGDYGDPCLFTSCPLLSAFSWPFSCSVASNPGIPWHQLTHITMAYMSTHQALDILRACKMLVKFNAKFDKNSVDQVQPLQNPVENRSLRSFHIYVYTTCSGLLQHLTLPTLTDFSLNTDLISRRSVSPRSVRTQLLRLFTRSKCKLERLKLKNCSFNDAGILKCLKHDSCSSLTKLEILNDFNRQMFTDRVFLALTKGNNVLLPMLSCLSLEMCISASPGVLGDMILNWCLYQLKSLTLFVKDLDDTDVASLEKAKKTGLTVCITIAQMDTDSEFTEDQYDTDDS
ncbi:hypothetical protein JOM56_008153 [Amanita muscaria]